LSYACRGWASFFRFSTYLVWNVTITSFSPSTLLAIWMISFAAALLCFFVDFTWLFDQFHSIFFVDNRSFPEESSFLIQSYPEAFFGRAAVEWIWRDCATLVVIYLIVRILVYAEKENTNSD